MRRRSCVLAAAIVLRAVSVGAAGRVQDRAYLALVEEYARVPR